MLNELELYLYSDGYGPTNEKLGTYLRELFGVRDPQPPTPSTHPHFPRPPEP
jgi:serine/threonine-protein kinase